jgi:hypothetical protein
MRSSWTLWLVLGVALSAPACSLYFPSRADDAAPVPDAGVVPDAAVGGPSGPGGDAGTMARCEDGTLYAVSVRDFQPTQPGHGAGIAFARCAGACRSAAVACSAGDCRSAAAGLCGAAPSQGAGCELEGVACAAGETIECPQTTTCGIAVAGQACACAGDSRYHCVPHSPVAAVQASLVGKWEGSVLPPNFASPYRVSLWIYPDGTYWAESEATGMPAFYYGGDGPHPERRIEILSATPAEGAVANIGIYFGGHSANVGALSALVVDATSLRFTFFASWFGCGQPFLFSLRRVGG